MLGAGVDEVNAMADRRRHGVSCRLGATCISLTVISVMPPTCVTTRILPRPAISVHPCFGWVHVLGRFFSFHYSGTSGV
jgi:hypothetical protein